jgi:CRISPR-associated protein Cmr1
MPRPLPKTSPPALTPQPGDAVIQQDFELLTPLCGGSHQPHQNDPSLLVRGTSVRGHLRFWWRACRAGEFNSTRDMQAQENHIWGSVDSPALVKVEVEILSVGVEGGDIRQFKDDVVPAYIAFPMTSRGAVGRAREDVAFRLRLRFPPALRRDVEAALWAWSTFGGLGGRTRRGFGALQERGAAQSVREVEARLRDDAWVFQNHAPDAGIPSLYGAKVVNLKEAAKDGIQAWFDAVYKMQDFRQARRKGSQPNRPGRSFWGEPDRIRELSGKAAPSHRTRVNEAKAFARAPFGLPILYQFKDGKDGDPSVHTLKGADVERQASPVILRPLRTAPGQYHGLAILLANSFHSPEGLVPGRLSLNGRAVEHRLSPADLASIKGQANLPASMQSLDTDVLASFLAWFAE